MYSNLYDVKSIILYEIIFRFQSKKICNKKLTILWYYFHYFNKILIQNLITKIFNVTNTQAAQNFISKDYINFYRFTEFYEIGPNATVLIFWGKIPELK